MFFLASYGRMISRNRLLSIFWEETSEEDARQRLRETISRLRQALPEPSVLITDGDWSGWISNAPSSIN